MATVTLDLAGLTTELVTLVTGKVDLGSADATGDLQILDGASAVLVTIPLLNPAFAAGTAPARVIAGAPLTAVAAVATGTAVSGRVRDRDNAVVFSGPVSLLGGLGVFQLDKVAITIGDLVQVLSGSVTYPA
jgi:hypothetical protein